MSSVAQDGVWAPGRVTAAADGNMAGPVTAMGTKSYLKKLTSLVTLKDVRKHYFDNW